MFCEARLNCSNCHRLPIINIGRGREAKAEAGAQSQGWSWSLGQLEWRLGTDVSGGRRNQAIMTLSVGLET